MSLSGTPISPELHRYLIDNGVQETAELAALRAEGAKLPEAEMQSSPESANLVALLIEIIGARNVIELGTFIGYGTLWMARAVGPGGRIVACDIEPKFPAIGRPYWEKAGVADRIDLRIGPALATLDALLAEGKAGGFDVVFIDADKSNYPNYMERGLKLLRVGGLLLVDNVLWSGDVIDPAKSDADTAAIRVLNARLYEDARVHLSMVPISDGLTIARKVA